VRLDARRLELRQGVLARAGQQVRAIGALGSEVDRGEHRAGGICAELLPPQLREPRRDRMRHRRRGRVSVSEAAEDLLALARGTPQDGVDETGAPAAAARALGEAHCLVHGGMVGIAAGEEQLVDAEAKRREERIVQLARRTAAELRDQVVGRPPALHRAVREGLRLGALAALEPSTLGRGAKRPVRPRPVLEDPPQGLVRDAARRRDRAQAGASVGGIAGAGRPRPRR
jgi:hypothetical protein